MISLIYPRGNRFIVIKKRKSPFFLDLPPGVCIFAGDPPGDRGSFPPFRTANGGTEECSPIFGMEFVVYVRQRVRDCVFTAQGMSEVCWIFHLAVNRLHQVTAGDIK